MKQRFNDLVNEFLLLGFAKPSVRKTHCTGRKHKENVRDYYQKWMEEQAQKLIDQTSKLPARAAWRRMLAFN